MLALESPTLDEVVKPDRGGIAGKRRAAIRYLVRGIQNMARTRWDDLIVEVRCY